MNRHNDVYAFVLRGEVAQVSADRATPDAAPEVSYGKNAIIRALPKDIRDSEHFVAADKMSLVYTAIATFENGARKFIQDRLLEDFGAEWWSECVPQKPKKTAEQRKADEEAHRYHGSRGVSLIYYTNMSDLPSIIEKQFDKSFSDYLPSVDWAKQIFRSIERSRNVIMHGGELAMDDIQRVGMNIRDWVQQVGE